MLPLYTRVLTTGDYGILALITLFTQLSGHILGLGTATSVFRFYRGSDSKNQKAQAFYSTLILVFLWSAMIFVIVCYFSEALSRVLFDSEMYSSHIIIGFGSMVFITLYNIPMFILRSEGKPILYITKWRQTLIF